MQSRINSFLVALVAAAVLIGTAGFARAELIAHWALDEAAGADIAVDQSGSTYQHNGVIDTTSGFGPTAGVAGKIGTAYSFSGQLAPLSQGGVTVTTGTGSELDTFTTVTLCAWFYTTHYEPDPRQYSPMLNRVYVPGQSWALWGLHHGSLQGKFGGPLNGDMMWAEDGKIYDYKGKWHQLVATYDGPVYKENDARPATAKVYLDGVWQATGTKDIDGVYPNGFDLLLGTCPDYSYASVMNGMLDDLGIWDEVLSNGKVGALYNVVEDLGLAYDLSDMKKLFDVYDTGTSDTIGGLDWVKDTALPGGHVDGDAWSDGSYYYVQLGSSVPTGVKAQIPEPSTLLLLATGLLGLMVYAWRKRK